jgi:FAD/FMN-containing dehydrogenase
MLTGLPAEAVESLLATAGPGAAPDLAMVEIRLMGGAVGRHPSVPNAVAGREGRYSLLTLGVLMPGAEESVASAGDAVHRGMGPWLAGTSLLNWLSGSATAAQVAACWTPAAYQRLLRVKRETDPGNVFRHGHALVP